jgi:PAS domain S-box-containing protein
MTRCLIADDNPQNIYLLESILKGHKFEVISAGNGVEALDAALKNPPDLIITDILMPVMDGFELCRKWKADERLAHIPFIFYTATYTDPKDEQFAMSLGAERFIVKPQKPEILMQAVIEVLEEYRKKTPGAPVKPPVDERETLREYNETLFRKLEKKVMDLEREIADRRSAETALRQSEIKFRTVVENVPDFVLVHRHGTILYINKSMLKTTGYEPSDILDKPISRFIAPEFHEIIESAIGARERGEPVAPFEVEILTKPGSRMTVMIRGSRIEFSGAPATLNVLTDITERKRAEEKLIRTEARYRKLYESMMDAFLRVNMAGQILEYNRSFAEMLGYSDEELRRMTYQDLTPAKWHSFENYIVETQILPHEYSSLYEKEYRKKDGTIVPVELRTYLTRDEAGQPSGMWAIVRDVTERKVAEDRIRSANRKLELMNDVTYQDIQNKVTGLRGYLELRIDRASEPERKKYLDRERAILASIHDLINNTKEYQQMGVDQSRWISLEQTIATQLSHISRDHEISLECDLHGLEIHADPLVDRVVFNLLHNAIRHGGSLTRISWNCRETSDGLVLFCEDDGVGIPFGEKPHIFDRVVGGEGKFGLFFVREFLTLSGMTISETGTPGKGARFEIAVPAGMYRFTIAG